MKGIACTKYRHAPSTIAAVALVFVHHPSFPRHPSFPGPAATDEPKQEQAGGKPVRNGYPGTGNDSVMAGVEGGNPGNSAPRASSRSPATPTRRRFLDVDEVGESSRTGLSTPGSNSSNSSARSSWSPRPSLGTPGHGRFIEDLEGVRGDAVHRMPAEACHRRSCSRESILASTDTASRDGAKSNPVRYVPLSVCSSTPPAPARCQGGGGGCREKRERRKRAVGAVVGLMRRLSRLHKNKKGKGRAACSICGDRRDWGFEESRRVALDSYSKVSVGITEVPEAWWRK